MFSLFAFEKLIFRLFSLKRTDDPREDCISNIKQGVNCYCPTKASGVG